MAEINTLGGDFVPILGNSYGFGVFTLHTKDYKVKTYRVPDDVANLELFDETNSKSLIGAAGWATAGAFIAGPVGLFAGALFGGQKHKVVFLAEFKDGNRIVAEIKKDIWIKLKTKMISK